MGLVNLICIISYDSYKMKRLEMKRSLSEMGVEYNLNFNYSNHFKTIHIHYRYKKTYAVFHIMKRHGYHYLIKTNLRK